MAEPENYIFRSKCVTKTGQNKDYFPKTIPRLRSALVQQILNSTIGVIIIGSIVFFFNTDLLASILNVYMVEFLYRVILLFEEQRHLLTRYSNSKKKLLKAVFSFSNTNIIVFISSAFIFLVSGFYLDNSLRNLCKNLPIILLVILTCKRFKPEDCYLNESLWISRNTGLDYGAGMAYSFYHGYLKLVLPKSGDENQDIRELMEDYESTNKVQFAIKKLFILIPKSLFCPTSLVDICSPSVTDAAKPLKEKRITRAGVTDRIYKNAVYKILSNNNELNYVCAEYATPLITFYNVVEGKGEHCGIYQNLKHDIVLQFYLTIKKILSDNEITHLCEPIFFDDRDSSGKSCDAGQMILARIGELKKRKD